MARTKETRRMSTGGKAPKRMRLPPAPPAVVMPSPPAVAMPPPAAPSTTPSPPPIKPPIPQGSAALPRGFLRGEWLTPGAKEQLQQELEPPEGKGLYQVVTDDDGRLCYRVVTDKKKLLMVSHQSSKCLEERSRVELITDQGHPCHTNPLPDVKLPAECERPQLRVVFEEDVGAAGTVVGTYWGHLRTLSEEEELVHLEGNTCSRLLLEDCSVTLDLPGKPGGPPITLSLVADPDLCRMAVCNDPRTWEEEMMEGESVSGAEEEPAANCHTETYLWVTQERGEPLYVPLVALVTSRRVEAGEEVTWSYGDPYWTAARRNMETYVKAYEEREAAQNMAQLALDSAEKVMRLQGPQASAEVLTALQCSLARAVQDMFTAHEHAANLWCKLHKSEQAGPLEERVWGLQVWCQEQWWGLLEAGSALMLQAHSDPPAAAAASAVPATAQQAHRTRRQAERMMFPPPAKVPRQGGAEVAGSSAVAPPCAAAAATAAAAAAAGPGSGRQQQQEQPAASAAAGPSDWRQLHRKPPPPPLQRQQQQQQQETKGKKRCWRETVHVSLPPDAPPEVVALLQKEKRLQQQDPAHPPMPRALLDLLLVPREEQQLQLQQEQQQERRQSQQRDQAAKRLPPLQPPPALLALLQEQQRLRQQQQQEGAVRPPVPVQPPLQQQQQPPPPQQQQQEEAVRPAVPVQPPQQQQQMPPPLPRQPLPVPPRQQQQQQQQAQPPLPGQPLPMLPQQQQEQQQQQQQEEQPQPAASVPLIVIPDDTPSPPGLARQWEEIGSSSKSAATVLMQQQLAGSDPGSAVGARGGVGGIEIPQEVTPHQQRPGSAKRCLENHWDDQQPPPQWEELEEQRIQQLEELERQQLEERRREREQLLQPEPPYCQQQQLQEEEEVQSPQPLQQQEEEGGCKRPGGPTQAMVMKILEHMRAQVLDTQMQLVLQHQEQVAQQIGLPLEALDALRAKAFEEASKRMLAPVEQSQQQQQQQQQQEEEEQQQEQQQQQEEAAEEVVDLTGEDD